MLEKLKDIYRKVIDVEIKRPLALWYTFITILTVLVHLGWSFGLIEQVYNQDVTKVSFLIFFVLIWKTIDCGVLIYKKTKTDEDVSDEDINSGWFWSDIVLSLGMVGTVIGFMIMLSSFGEADFSDVENSKKLISDLSQGMSTALLTTLSGLLCSILIKIQFFSLEAFCSREEA